MQELIKEREELLDREEELIKHEEEQELYEMKKLLAKLNYFEKELPNFEAILDYEIKRKNKEDPSNNKKDSAKKITIKIESEYQTETDGASSSRWVSEKHTDELNQFEEGGYLQEEETKNISRS